MAHKSAPTISIRCANRITLFIRRALVKNCTDCVSREPVEPVISLRAVFINLSFRRDKQKTPFGAFILTRRVGDPQTYALLHCSVFKERTPTPNLFSSDLLASLFAVGAGVTTSIIPRWGSEVKRDSRIFSQRISCDFSRARRRSAFARFPQTRMLHQAPEPFFDSS